MNAMDGGPYEWRRRVRRGALAALLCAGPLAPGAGAQEPAERERSADERAVLETVQRLFDGMRANDAEMVRSVFAEGAVLIGTEREDRPATRISPVDGFVQAVGNATAVWDEPFWDPVIHIQDHLATVWTKYAFYLDGTFSHCGVDALILARSDQGWKIAALADTRARENCELPPDR